MADDLKLQIEVGADVTGKANVDAMGQSIDKIGAAEKRVQTSTERLDQAFNTLGIRSAKQIEADILGVNQSLLKLASDSRTSGAEMDRAYRQVKSGQ